jgi:hypothetical protein
VFLPAPRRRPGQSRLRLAVVDGQVFIRGAVLDAVEVAFESIHVSGPEPTERSEPGIDLLKWFSFQPVETALCVHRGFYETGLSQHSQVL